MELSPKYIIKNQEMGHNVALIYFSIPFILEKCLRWSEQIKLCVCCYKQVRQLYYMLATMATPMNTSSHAFLIPDGGQTFYNNIPPRHQLQRNRKISILLKFIELVRKTTTRFYGYRFEYTPSTI
jgi:hypothetical protein